MNYRHAFHAGNFADVLKHAALAAIVTRLKQKDTPFRVIDTHAGIGRYDLASGEATRTGEWQNGIARFLGPEAAPLEPELAAVLAPYLEVVAGENPGGDLRWYPGSPLVARRLLRSNDRLVVNELHPDDAARLKGLFARDRQTKVLELDAWIALKSLLPPKERRGLVLVDPPFEQPGELDRLVEGLGQALRRFATGIYLLWYPIKDPKPVAKFHHALGMSGQGKILKVEVLIRRPTDVSVLNGCGLVVVNPPYALGESLAILAKAVAERCALAPGALGSVSWIALEKR